jgi:hypothetical protein
LLLVAAVAVAKIFLQALAAAAVQEVLELRQDCQ